ncbi:hypothetical protein P872_07985 [Rhodonellum psychrophilum GCM71 = DSM 17998]|uniref:Uncharacterized protein n=1 Tax=Rhodonellum psychrophilum GCM71 = DSM 17998 TaxID=1123057 RepID=U5BN19_9BACT|nr:hypothetical protein P872_07985 [Rhodonellum psychrophilum GCM71 = DSM 17998]
MAKGFIQSKERMQISSYNPSIIKKGKQNASLFNS